MNKFTEGQIEAIKQVTNTFIDRKMNYLNEGEEFLKRFNSGRMAENIECELVNKRNHMFKITNEITVKDITDICESILIEELKKRGI